MIMDTWYVYIISVDSLVSHYIMCSFFFFFKQKTAYEMRISDWSSDVCSSDLCATLFCRRTAAINRFRNRSLWGPTHDRCQLAGTPGFWHDPVHGMERLAAILGIILPGIM